LSAALGALRHPKARTSKRESLPAKRFTLPNLGVNQYILIGTNFHGWRRSEATSESARPILRNV
jgi:hypothetical protein